ncbi:HNH endonuclease [Runella sp.]|uniref:HNH endonuclease n=1 Tax=Runella sp. TaxID=1960881 RepID=UPI003D0C159E
MIQLASNDLDKDVQQELDNLQFKVDNELTFAKKVEKAQSLWNSKGGVKGKQAFEKITTRLYGLCVSEGICNYCEQSEANDVEHIYPKSFFPDKAFQWENYLLACKQCNSGYKLDKCHVLDADNELIVVNRGTEPLSKIGAFINPRTENPNEFMILNLMTFKFDTIPGLSKRDINKVKSTLEILELNKRDPLLVTRKSAARYYYEMLERLVRILEVLTIEELQNLLTPCDDRFDLTQPLESIKDEIKISYKKSIGNHQHPSVWYSIKMIESKVNTKWKKLFDKIPEALTW